MSEPPKIHPELLPHVYFNLCLNESSCSVIFNVCATFSVPLDTDKVDFLGMVPHVYVLLILAEPKPTPELKLALQDTDFVPSELCDTVIYFVAKVFVFPTPKLRISNELDEYNFVPLIVIEMDAPLLLYEEHDLSFLIFKTHSSFEVLFSIE